LHFDMFHGRRLVLGSVLRCSTSWDQSTDDAYFDASLFLIVVRQLIDGFSSPEEFLT